MPKIIDLRSPGEEAPEGSVLVSPRLAELFRRVCQYARRPADAVFEEMLELYITECTDLEPVYDDEPPASHPSGSTMPARRALSLGPASRQARNTSPYLPPGARRRGARTPPHAPTTSPGFDEGDK